MASRSAPAASESVPIDPEIAGQAVRAYLREIGAYSDQAGRRFRVAVRDQSLVVRVSTPLDLSITVGELPRPRSARRDRLPWSSSARKTPEVRGGA